MKTPLSPLCTLFLPVALSFAAVGCGPPPDVTIYCACDQVDSERILLDFQEKTGLVVRMEFDSEASKTVELVKRIRKEKNRPRCDVFWNNEIAHTVALANDGFLAEYDSPNAAEIPETFRDPQRRWTGFAARARVFIVNTDLVENVEEVHGMWDLVDPKWDGKSTMAAPLTGTTLTHAVALFTVLGEEKALEYLKAVKDRCRVAASNGQTMKLVREGAMAFGWTDTDDYNRARVGGYPVAMVYPDAGEGELGTLFIPNTVSIMKEAPNPENAKKLVDYLLSLDVERKLAKLDGAQIPLHTSLKGEEHQLPIEGFRAMEIDYSEIGAAMAERQVELKEMFVD